MDTNEYKGMQGYNDFDFPEDPERKFNDNWKVVKVLVILTLFQIQQDGFNYETIQEN